MGKVSEEAITSAFAMEDTSLLDCLADVAFDARDETLGQRICEHARRNHAILASWGSLGMSSGPPRAHLAGLSAASCKRWDEAIASFEEAERQARQTGLKPHAVWAVLRRAETLVRRGEGRDRDEARGLADAAARLAEELGMDIVAARARVMVDEPPARTSTPEAASVPETSFDMVREGEGFRFEHRGHSFLLKDTKGVRLLEKLVAEPGREHHVLDLSSPTGRRAAGATGDAGDAIDAQARDAYRSRILDLRAELGEAEANNDPGRAERARAEIRALEAELSRVLGLGGKSRKAASASERARVNVQRRLKDAIKRVEAQDAELARHLSWAIRTGTLCSYRPW
jgi:ElaB/YqjD/DUF883 family membrane-anchored ribosome-binding protein